MLSFLSSEPLLSACLLGILVYVIAGGFELRRLYSNKQEKEADAKAVRAFSRVK